MFLREAIAENTKNGSNLRLRESLRSALLMAGFINVSEVSMSMVCILFLSISFVIKFYDVNMFPVIFLDF